MSSTVVVSLRSKGVPNLITNQYTFRSQFIGLVDAISDLPIAALVTISQLSWSAWISILITIVVMGVDIENEDIEGDTSAFGPLFAYIVLPLLVLIYLVITRRDQARAAIGRFKISYAALRMHASAYSNGLELSGTNHSLEELNVPTAAQELDEALASLSQHLRRYLAHKRPYAQHFFVPYRPDALTSDTMHRVTREIGLLSTSVNLSIRQVLACTSGLTEALATPAALPTGMDPTVMSSTATFPYRADHQSYQRSFTGQHNSMSQAALTPDSLCVNPVPGHTEAGQEAGGACIIDAGNAQEEGQPHSTQHAQHDMTGATASVPSEGTHPQHMPSIQVQGQQTQYAVHQGQWQQQQQQQQRHAAGSKRHVYVGSAGMSSRHLATCMHLNQQITSLHLAVEELMAVKEQHTPVLIRSSVRWFSVILMPVFMGWYWLQSSRVVKREVGGIMAVACQIALMVLVDTLTQLEDPFDNLALDAVSCEEAFTQADMISSDGSDNVQDQVATPSSPHNDKGSQNMGGHTAPNTLQHNRKRSAATSPGVAMQMYGETTKPPSNKPVNSHVRANGNESGENVITVGGLDTSMSPPMPPPPASLTALAAASSLAALSGGR